MKKVLCKGLILFFVFSFLSSFLFAGEISETDRKRVYLMNEYTYYTTLVKLSENRLVLTEVYEHLTNDYSSREIDSVLGEKLESMMGLITNLEINSLKKERLNVIFDLQKSQALASAIPNPAVVLGTFATGAIGVSRTVSAKSPREMKEGISMILAAVVSTVNIASSSISKYQAAKNENLITYLNDKWDLEYDEMRLVNFLNTDMFNLQNSIANELRLEDKYVIKEKDMQAFVKKVQNDQNTADKIAFLESHARVYSEFPLYWLELAKAYGEFGKYDKCYETIQQYYGRFEDYSSIFDKEKNIREGQVLVFVVNALLNINEDNPLNCKEEIIRLLEKIEACTKDEDWLQKYFCGLIYLMYSEKIGDGLSRKAMEIFRQNAMDLAFTQSKLNSTYIKDLVVVADDEKNQMTKAQREDLEKTEEMARENRKTELPPLNSAFLENLKAYVAIADKREILTDSVLVESSVKEELLLPPLKDAIFSEISNTSNLYGFAQNQFSLDWPLILLGKTRTLTLKIPAVFLTSSTVMNLGIQLEKNGSIKVLEPSEESKAYTYRIKEVKRPSKTKYDVNSYIAEVKITIPSDIDAANDDYSIAILVDTGYCPITLFFSSKTGKRNGLSFDYLEKNFDGFEISNEFNIFQSL